MARVPGDSWSAGRIETLTRMAADGHTAADVAVRLGTSRSAVLGKAKRLGVRFGAQDGPRPPAEIAVFEHSDCRRVDIAVAMPDPKPRRRIRASLIVVAADEPTEAPPAPTALPSPPDDDQATQGEAMEAAPETGPSPVGAAFPVTEPTPKGWPKPAGPNAVSLQDLREQHCRMPLWDLERSGLYCGEPAPLGQAYCAACRPLTVDVRQTRTVQERAASSAKFASRGRTGAFA